MVSAPGHTANHVCVLVQDGDTTFLLAGDASYNETTMLDGKVDGVSPDEKISVAALRAIKHLRGRVRRSTCRHTIRKPATASKIARR